MPVKLAMDHGPIVKGQVAQLVECSSRNSKIHISIPFIDNSSNEQHSWVCISQAINCLKADGMCGTNTLKKTSMLVSLDINCRK